MGDVAERAVRAAQACADYTVIGVVVPRGRGPSFHRAPVNTKEKLEGFATVAGF